MKQKITSILLIILLFPVLLYSQEKSFKYPAPLKYESESIGNNSQSSFPDMTLANWVIVDTMGNSFGPAVGTINPLAYDAYADVVALVHRSHTSYAGSSSDLWYNISTDAGLNWTRISSLAGSLNISARYPSFAISNPSEGNITQTRGVAVWKQTNGDIGYGYAMPLTGGTIFSDTITSDNSGGVGVCWTGGDWSYWTGSSFASDFEVYRTTDFVTVEKIVSPNLSGAGLVICLGGVSDGNTSYLAFLGTIEDPDTNNPIISGFYPCYSKSTDNGLTWGEVVPADFRTIPALSQYDRLFDFIKNDVFVSYTAGDINVDANGYVHLIFSVTDTTSSSNTGLNSLVEVYETASGWDGKVIYEGISETIFTTKTGVALGQMGPNGYLAFDKDREMMACVWVTGDNAAQDLCDVYISFRSLDSEWSTPINLTQTESMNENGAHLAPVLKKNSDDSYTAFVGYFYQLGYFGPDPNSSNPTGFWVTPVTYTPTDVTEPVTGITNFNLEQNYPNPFNPATKISWQSPVGGWQTLVVYDVLGNEVATLVNEYQNAGSYDVEFNAGNLASGVYYYRLRAGDLPDGKAGFIQTKKMILLK